MIRANTEGIASVGLDNDTKLDYLPLYWGRSEKSLLSYTYCKCILVSSLEDSVMSTPIFVAPGIPDIRTSFGRESYRTKGQHEQCQPTVPPDEIAKRRREFFAETLFADLNDK